MQYKYKCHMNTSFVVDFFIYIFIHIIRYNHSSGQVYVRLNQNKVYVYVFKGITFIT